MKLKDIKIGKTYTVESVDGSNLPWRGRAKVVRFDPPCYDKNTIDCVCDDGEEGVFEASEFIEESDFPMGDSVSTLKRFVDLCERDIIRVRPSDKEELISLLAEAHEAIFRAGQ